MAVLLQRSRDVIVAGTTTSTQPDADAITLQRGRDIIVAETLVRARAFECTGEASTRPRHYRREDGAREYCAVIFGFLVAYERADR